MNKNLNNCDCQLSSGCRLATAYVVFQELNQVFNQREALQRGTLFPELYMPYAPADRVSLGGRYNG